MYYQQFFNFAYYAHKSNKLNINLAALKTLIEKLQDTLSIPSTPPPSVSAEEDNSGGCAAKALDNLKLSQVATQHNFIVKYITKKKVKTEKIRAEYMITVSFRANPQPITAIPLKIEKNKHATMIITRNNEVRKFQTYTNFTLGKIGFLEWVEIHDISKNQKLKDTSQLLEYLAQKFK
ncbi:hypothetical protein Tco_0169490 [Tanacetum coccineum]